MKQSFDRMRVASRSGCFRVVVEAQRGSRLKFEYDAKLGAFTVARPLPLGMSYPFDWGFIPSTRAADGDPVDEMLLNAVPPCPGIVAEARQIGMVELVQTAPGIPKEINNRIVLLPGWHDAHLEEASDLPAEIQKQIESLTDKKVQTTEWASAKKGTRFITDHRVKD